MRTEKPKNTFSVTLVMEFFREWERKSKLEDLPQADFGLYPKILYIENYAHGLFL